MFFKAGRETLLQSVRNGKLSITGGMMITISKKIEAFRWQKLIQAQSEGFDSLEEAGLESMIDSNKR